MRTATITLDQGINLGTPTSDLAPGEMSLARNCHYQPESTTLFKVGGRATYGSVAGAAATGLGFTSFRNGTRFLLRTAGTDISAANLTLGAGFSSIGTFSGASGQSDIVYYNGTDRAYIVDGVNSPKVWSGSGSVRDLGLLTPTVSPTATLVSNAATQYSVGDIFSYCYTEYDSVNDIESPASASVEIQIVATGDTVKFVMSAPINGGSDKFRVYRTQVGGDVFFRLAEVSTAIRNYYDGQNTEGAAATRQDNGTTWGFYSLDDLFLSVQPVLAMLGSPLAGNYMTVNGRPPIGNIAVIFEGSLCISGIGSFPQDIYYSQPDSPEQFSPVYFLREENSRGDAVTGLGVANDRLIAFTLNSIFRHDTLPRITDPGFGVGASTRQLVTSDHGCVAKRTVCNYGVGAPNNRLFYLSTRGPFATDGYTTQPLGHDMDWSDRLVNFGAISGAVAVNFPKYFQIRLFLPSPGSSTNDICYVYHYHPKHAKESTGVGKWTGPLHVRCNSATVAYQENNETRLFIADANTSGQVYEEDLGLTDAQHFENGAGQILWEWRTGDYDFGSQAANKKVKRIFVNYVGTDAFSPPMTYSINHNDQENNITLANVTQNSSGLETYGTTSTIAQLKSRRSRGGVWQTGTHFRFHMRELAAGTDRAISKIEVEIEPYGVQK